MNIGFGITGSFCTHDKALKAVENLIKKGHNVLPIVSSSVFSTDTRFGKAKDFLKKLEEITKNKIISSVVEAEPIGPKNLIDILVIAPCTGNTLAKLANGITDSAVTMTAKAHTRNNKPVVIAVSTNDALGMSLKNIATLLNTKNYYFVPMKQDNPEQKPKSMVAEFDKIEETIMLAIENKQIQPLF